MRSMRKLVRLSGVLAVVGSGVGAAAAQEVVPLADPAHLERLGWPADAVGMTITPGALVEMEREIAAHELGQEVEEPAASAPAAVAAESGFSLVTPASFQQADTSGAAVITTAPSLLCGTGDTTFEAQIPDLPDGGTFAGARAWYFDGHSQQSVTIVLYRSCLPVSSAGSPTNTTLGSHVSLGEGGNRTAAFSIDDPIDTEACAYLVRLHLGTSCGSAVLAFSKLRVAWTPPAEPAGPLVFESGFESGTFTGWSFVQP